jgi:exopolysaccharide biosynthesis polyprenyl glycosylphosphotransferase
MKRFELVFTFLQLPLDYLAIILAGFAAYSLRFSNIITSIRPVVFNLGWEKYWPLVLMVGVGWLIIFALNGLYKVDPNRKFATDLSRIFMACSTGFAAITIYVFFTLQKFDSRFLVLMSGILAIIFVIIERMTVRGIKAILYHYGIGQRILIIIGNENISRIISESFKQKKYLGYSVVGVFSHFNEEIKKQIKDLRSDEILFTDPKASEEEALQAVDFANENHLTFKYSADLFATISTNMAVYTVAGIPVIELRRTRIGAWGRISKRLLDILLSLFLIIFLSPIYLIIALVILIETGRPIIYKNERLGQKGKKFTALKFRSMYQKYCTGEQFNSQNQEALTEEEKLITNQNIKDGPVYKIKDDPRVTKFGSFIRTWSLDELPQFWNIFKGEMSLVGPRPHQPREIAKYQKWHKIVMVAKPGLTGMAQVSGRSNLTFDEEVKLDTFYIENWSLLLDLIILIKTPFVVIKRKGAW